jgi:hypothetical protein
MFTAKFVVEGKTPISFSRFLTEKPMTNEKKDEFDLRIAKDKAHFDEKGDLYIPGMMVKKALASTAAYLNEKIPGKRNATYTKHFVAGVLCPNDAPLMGKDGKKIHKDKAEVQSFPCAADGKKGGKGGATVIRSFPCVREWKAEFEVQVADDVIDEKIFKKVLTESGIINGLGRFRPQNGGSNGRFEIKNFRWDRA